MQGHNGNLMILYNMITSKIIYCEEPKLTS